MTASGVGIYLQMAADAPLDEQGNAYAIVFTPLPDDANGFTRQEAVLSTAGVLQAAPLPRTPAVRVTAQQVEQELEARLTSANDAEQVAFIGLAMTLEQSATVQPDVLAEFFKAHRELAPDAPAEAATARRHLAVRMAPADFVELPAHAARLAQTTRRHKQTHELITLLRRMVVAIAEEPALINATSTQDLLKAHLRAALGEVREASFIVTLLTREGAEPRRRTYHTKRVGETSEFETFRITDDGAEVTTRDALVGALLPWQLFSDVKPADAPAANALDLWTLPDYGRTWTLQFVDPLASAEITGQKIVISFPSKQWLSPTTTTATAAAQTPSTSSVAAPTPKMVTPVTSSTTSAAPPPPVPLPVSVVADLARATGVGTLADESVAAYAPLSRVLINDDEVRETTMPRTSVTGAIERAELEQRYAATAPLLLLPPTGAAAVGAEQDESARAAKRRAEVHAKVAVLVENVAVLARAERLRIVDLLLAMQEIRALLEFIDEPLFVYQQTDDNKTSEYSLVQLKREKFSLDVERIRRLYLVWGVGVTRPTFPPSLHTTAPIANEMVVDTASLTDNFRRFESKFSQVAIGAALGLDPRSVEIVEAAGRAFSMLALDYAGGFDAQIRGDTRKEYTSLLHFLEASRFAGAGNEIDLIRAVTSADVAGGDDDDDDFALVRAMLEAVVKSEKRLLAIGAAPIRRGYHRAELRTAIWERVQQYPFYVEALKKMPLATRFVHLPRVVMRRNAVLGVDEYSIDEVFGDLFTKAMSDVLKRLNRPQFVTAKPVVKKAEALPPTATVAAVGSEPEGGEEDDSKNARANPTVALVKKLNQQQQQQQQQQQGATKSSESPSAPVPGAVAAATSATTEEVEEAAAAAAAAAPVKARRLTVAQALTSLIEQPIKVDISDHARVFVSKGYVDRREEDDTNSVFAPFLHPGWPFVGSHHLPAMQRTFKLVRRAYPELMPRTETDNFNRIVNIEMLPYLRELMQARKDSDARYRADRQARLDKEERDGLPRGSGPRTDYENQIEAEVNAALAEWRRQRFASVGVEDVSPFTRLAQQLGATGAPAIAGGTGEASTSSSAESSMQEDLPNESMPGTNANNFDLEGADDEQQEEAGAGTKKSKKSKKKREPSEEAEPEGGEKSEEQAEDEAVAAEEDVDIDEIYAARARTDEYYLAQPDFASTDFIFESVHYENMAQAIANLVRPSGAFVGDDVVTRDLLFPARTDAEALVNTEITLIERIGAMFESYGGKKKRFTADGALAALSDPAVLRRLAAMQRQRILQNPALYRSTQRMFAAIKKRSMQYNIDFQRSAGLKGLGAREVEFADIAKVLTAYNKEVKRIEKLNAEANKAYDAVVKENAKIADAQAKEWKKDKDNAKKLRDYKKAVETLTTAHNSAVWDAREEGREEPPPPTFPPEPRPPAPKGLKTLPVRAVPMPLPPLPVMTPAMAALRHTFDSYEARDDAYSIKFLAGLSKAFPVPVLADGRPSVALKAARVRLGDVAGVVGGTNKKNVEFVAGFVRDADTAPLFEQLLQLSTWRTPAGAAEAGSGMKLDQPAVKWRTPVLAAVSLLLSQTDPLKAAEGGKTLAERHAAINVDVVALGNVGVLVGTIIGHESGEHHSYLIRGIQMADTARFEDVERLVQFAEHILEHTKFTSGAASQPLGVSVDVAGLGPDRSVSRQLVKAAFERLGYEFSRISEPGSVPDAARTIGVYEISLDVIHGDSTKLRPRVGVHSAALTPFARTLVGEWLESATEKTKADWNRRHALETRSRYVGQNAVTGDAIRLWTPVPLPHFLHQENPVSMGGRFRSISVPNSVETTTFFSVRCVLVGIRGNLDGMLSEKVVYQSNYAPSWVKLKGRVVMLPHQTRWRMRTLADSDQIEEEYVGEKGQERLVNSQMQLIKDLLRREQDQLTALKEKKKLDSDEADAVREKIEYYEAGKQELERLLEKHWNNNQWRARMSGSLDFEEERYAKWHAAAAAAGDADASAFAQFDDAIVSFEGLRYVDAASGELKHTVWVDSPLAALRKQWADFRNWPSPAVLNRPVDSSAPTGAFAAERLEALLMVDSERWRDLMRKYRAPMPWTRLESMLVLAEHHTDDEPAPRVEYEAGVLDYGKLAGIPQNYEFQVFEHTFVGKTELQPRVVFRSKAIDFVRLVAESTPETLFAGAPGCEQRAIVLSENALDDAPKPGDDYFNELLPHVRPPEKIVTEVAYEVECPTLNRVKSLTLVYDASINAQLPDMPKRLVMGAFYIDSEPSETPIATVRLGRREDIVEQRRRDAERQAAKQRALEESDVRLERAQVVYEAEQEKQQQQRRRLQKRSTAGGGAEEEEAEEGGGEEGGETTMTTSTTATTTVPTTEAEPAKKPRKTVPKKRITSIPVHKDDDDE
jgi:hypothetical protein